jgi:branched-chain amino acid transport system permease protein
MDYLLHIAIIILINIILTVSFNILLGYAGIFALCHAAFYGIGAYTATLLMKNLGVPFFPALACAVGVTALCSLIVALPGLRIHWDYMVIFAFSFQMVIYHVMVNWVELTRGPQGIAGIPTLTILGFPFDSKVPFLLFSLIVTLVVVYLVKRIEASSFGLVLKGIKDDEIAVKSVGKPVTAYKIISFVIAASLAAVAGGLISVYISYISPGYFDLHASIFILICLIFGGMGSIRGAILGTVVLTALPELLRFIPYLPSTMMGGIRDLIYAAILILFMLYRPQGIVGKASR